MYVLSPPMYVITIVCIVVIGGDLQLGEEIDVRDSIPEDKMNEIVDDLVKMDVKAVTFSGGGEPFLYKPFT